MNLQGPAPLPPEFAEPLAQAAGRLGPFGRRILWYPEVPSTNDVATVLAERGAADGCVVAANAQSAGRGRHGRRWASPAGAGLYVSTVLRPGRHAMRALTIAAGVAVSEGIQAATGLEVGLKWPNDVYAGDRKLAGVLAEAADAIEYVVLGFGINVMPAAYPPDIAARATSLEDELGRVVDRGLLLAECLSALARRYGDLRGGRTGAVIEAWRRRAGRTLGRRVRWEAAGSAIEGVAENIDDTGALLVRTPAGVVAVTAGEVRWV
ncbi:MAG: biotin--[acetyl-CoA-carboxylase] ligase [Acidobacteria bacterium RIFCSPLOWO2_12_FULL_68_19]|nr:MAG: biotin--[acetyl-CoA-carboxylase] ligase [Acidobacteria bacterium RIFCSPLOWO2_12_FULL_68_19]